MKQMVGRGGAVVRALVSHPCVLGSIPRPGVISGSSLLLVIYSALRGFSLGTLVFSSPQIIQTNISKLQFDPGMQGHF